MNDQQVLMPDDLKNGAEDGGPAIDQMHDVKMTRRAAPMMEDRQSPIPDDQTHGAEDVE